MRTRARHVLVMVMGFAVSVAVSGQSIDIVFVNTTGATIYYLYASPPSADDWGLDLLGNTVLPDGGSFRARLRPADALDIRAVDANDNEYIIWNWPVAPSGRVAIRQDAFAGTGVVPGDSALAWLNIRNETNYTLVSVIALPAGMADWDAGQSLLPERATILDGEEYRVDIDTQTFDTMIYDFLLIDEDGDRYIKWDVNLELTAEVVCTLDDLLLR